MLPLLLLLLPYSVLLPCVPLGCCCDGILELSGGYQTIAFAYAVGSGSVVISNRDAVQRVDVESGKVLQNMTNLGSVQRLWLSPDESMLVADGGPGTTVYNAVSGTPQYTIPVANDVAFSSDSATFVAIGPTMLSIFNATDGELVKDFFAASDSFSGRCVAWSEKVIATGLVGNIRLWDSEGNVFRAIEFDGNVVALRFSPDASLIIGTSVSGERGIFAWTMKGALLWKFSTQIGPAGLAFAEDGTVLFADSSLHALHPTTGEHLWEIPLAGYGSYLAVNGDLSEVLVLVGSGQKASLTVLNPSRRGSGVYTSAGPMTADTPAPEKRTVSPFSGAPEERRPDAVVPSGVPDPGVNTSTSVPTEVFVEVRSGGGLKVVIPVLLAGLAVVAIVGCVIRVCVQKKEKPPPCNSIYEMVTE